MLFIVFGIPKILRKIIGQAIEVRGNSAFPAQAVITRSILWESITSDICGSMPWIEYG
jgi:hypothetical protein